MRWKGTVKRVRCLLVRSGRHARYVHLVEGQGKIGRENYRMDVEGACGCLWTTLRLGRLGRVGGEYGQFASDAARASGRSHGPGVKRGRSRDGFYDSEVDGLDAHRHRYDSTYGVLFCDR